MPRYRPSTVVVVTVSVMLVVYVVAITLDMSRTAAQKQASLFFSSALAAQHISAQVTVGGTRFQVTNDNISDDKDLSDRERFGILRVAYARAMAERSPLIAIPGTDPDELEGITNRLQQVAKDLSAVQKNEKDTEAVRTALYPIDFLRSLASLERARKTFIASGIDRDEARYELSARNAVAAFEKDLRLHKDAFEAIVPSDAAAYQVFEGTITRQSLLDSMDDLMRGIRGTRAALMKRSSCLSGSINVCDASMIALPNPSRTEMPRSDNTQTHDVTFLNEIKSSYALATGNASYASGPTFELANSACLENFDAPFLFTVQNRRKAQDATLTPEFVGDILFVPTETYKDIPYYRFFADNDIAYAYFPIWEHYKCPEIVLDTAHVFGTLAVRNAARYDRFSQYALDPEAAMLHAIEARLLEPAAGIVRESDAREYVALALHALAARPLTPPQVTQKLLDLSLADEYGTTHFEKFILRLLNDETVNIGLMHADIPVELGAEYLFYVRSGFFSLSLGTNPSVVGIQRPPVDQNASSSPRSPFVRYTELRASVPRSELVRDMTFFFRIHVKASGYVPTE